MPIPRGAGGEKKPSKMLRTIAAIRAIQRCKPETDGLNRLRTSCLSQTQFARPSTFGPMGRGWRVGGRKAWTLVEQQ